MSIKIGILLVLCFFFLELSNNLAEGITKGHDVTLKDISFYVKVMVRLDESHPWKVCAGSVIYSYWIITAAHCFPNTKLDQNLEILALPSWEDISCKYRQSFTATNYFIFNSSRSQSGFIKSDIALVKLESPLPSNNQISYIALPDQDSEVSGIVTIYGSGDIDQSGQKPKVVQTADLPIVDLEECKKAYEGTNELDLFDSQVFNKGIICAGSTDVGVSVCKGDSGGPVVQKNVDNVLVLVGIVWIAQKPCGNGSRPNIFTRVSSYVTWINEQISKHSFEKEQRL